MRNYTGNTDDKILLKYFRTWVNLKGVAVVTGMTACAADGARCELEGMTPELAIESITNEESMKHVPYFIIHDAVMGKKFGSLREFYLFSEREIIDIINTRFEKYQKSMGIQKSVC